MHLKLGNLQKSFYQGQKEDEQVLTKWNKGSAGKGGSGWFTCPAQEERDHVSDSYAVSYQMGYIVIVVNLHPY